MKNQHLRAFLTTFMKSWWPLIGLLLIAFGLRIFRLDAQSLWWDEGISLHLATSSLVEIVADRINNIHPPLYFFILKIWLQLTGVNPFSARYLSVLASWLQVALLFAVLRRWFGGYGRGSATAWVGGVLLTFSAVAIIYGQETRVYAFLPLVFLALLAITQQILKLETTHSRANWRSYSGLGCVAWLGLHLHYIVAFLVVYVALWAAIVFLRKRLWGAVWRWLITYVLVGSASLPWFGALVWNWTAVQAEANAGTFATEPVPFDFLIQQVWVFHLTGLAGSLADPFVRWLAGVTAVLFLLLLGVRLSRQVTRRTTVQLIAHWLVPLSLALLVWRVRSFSHPRYIVMYTIGLTLLAAFLIWPGKGGNRKEAKDTKFKRGKVPVWDWLLSGLLAVGLLLLSGWGLYHYYFASDTAKDDVRAVARYLEVTAVAGDLILVPDTDYSFEFEYAGATRVAMPGVDQPEQMWMQLEALTTGVPHVFVLDYKRGTRDWQQIVPFVLENAGTLVAETAMDALIVREYLLETAVTPPKFISEQTHFGPLLLTDVWLEQAAPANSAVTLALRWKLTEPVNAPLNLALRLRDENGWMVTAEDDLLLDGNGRPTDQWDMETAVVTYHVLPLKAGMVADKYVLNASVYSAVEEIQVLDILNAQGAVQGQEYTLGRLSLAAPMPAANGLRAFLVPPTDQPLTFGSGLKLAGSTIETPELLAGQTAWVQLLWQLPVAAEIDTESALLLLSGETIVAEDKGQAGYALAQGQPGDLIAQRRSLRIPPGMVGELTVAVQVGTELQPIGELTVGATDRVFEETAVANPLDVEFGGIARLVGYEIPQRLHASAAPVAVTLFWEALDDGREDFTIFTHMLAADEQLIGQHDGMPVNGTRPTSTWLHGEFLVDPHMITLNAGTYQGQAHIKVGLYDPQTGERLRTQDGADFFILPEIITIQ